MLPERDNTAWFLKPRPDGANRAHGPGSEASNSPSSAFGCQKPLSSRDAAGQGPRSAHGGTRVRGRPDSNTLHGRGGPPSPAPPTSEGRGDGTPAGRRGRAPVPVRAPAARLVPILALRPLPAKSLFSGQERPTPCHSVNWAPRPQDLVSGPFPPRSLWRVDCPRARLPGRTPRAAQGRGEQTGPWRQAPCCPVPTALA